MKKILIFENGVGVLDTNSIHSVRIDGKDPVETIDYTQENLKKHFPDIENEVRNTDIVV